jgi:uncharacterized membrane protein YhaH (DUF805 family)
MFDALRRYRDFGGRASRSEYWLFIFFMILTNSFGVVLFSMVSGVTNLSVYSEPNNAGLFVILLMAAFNLAMLVPNLSVAFRRMHDSGHSGAWIVVLPVFLVFSLMDGTPGANRYGNDPKVRFDGATLA